MIENKGKDNDGTHGLVIRNTGSWYVVKTDAGQLVHCKVKGNFRLRGIKSTNPVVVGDKVSIKPNAEGTAFITEIDDRANYIIRRSSNLSKQSHIIAANVDQAYLVATINHPVTSTVFIDRFLATAEAYRVRAKLIINKTDIYDDDEKRYMSLLVRLYEGIGYETHCVSAVTGEGMDALRADLAGKVTLFSGNSGVGKSTLLNLIVPEAQARTGDVSDAHNTGTHTTTASEMYALPEGGYIIDTPGIKGFGTIDMADGEIGHFFPEIFKFSAECRFGNCTHRNEPGCAVKKAVEEHLISESRYTSYLGIFEDKEEGKYRAPY